MPKLEQLAYTGNVFVVAAIGFLYSFSINFEGLRLCLTMRET